MSEQQTQQAAIDEATLAQLENDPAFQEVPGIESESEAAESAAVLPPTKELIKPICDLATKVFCPQWEIQPQEVDALSDAYAAVIDKYFPNAAEHMTVELNALLITAAIFGPRLASGIPPRPVKKREEATEFVNEPAEGEHEQTTEQPES